MADKAPPCQVVAIAIGPLRARPSSPRTTSWPARLQRTLGNGGVGVVLRRTYEPTRPLVRERLQAKGKATKPESVPEATSPSAGATAALKSAQTLYKQVAPAVWFDSWGNDLRDNDVNGRIDDRREQGIPDGAHYGKPHKAMVCKTPADRTDACSIADQSKIDVAYKVCIDIPIESYKSAGVSVSSSRWIPTFFGQLRKHPDWTVWKAPERPARLLDGDIVAASNATHQHAGLIETGAIYDSVLNLPGPSAARTFRIFNPSGRNDMASVPRVAFEAYLGIDWFARSHK